MKDQTPDMSLDLLNLPFLTESTPAKDTAATHAAVATPAVCFSAELMYAGSVHTTSASGQT